jgi:hypothetical protein
VFNKSLNSYEYALFSGSLTFPWQQKVFADLHFSFLIDEILQYQIISIISQYLNIQDTGASACSFSIVVFFIINFLLLHTLRF